MYSTPQVWETTRQKHLYDNLKDLFPLSTFSEIMTSMTEGEDKVQGRKGKYNSETNYLKE